MIGEAEPLLGHSIEIWSLKLFLTITSKISVSQIVSHDIDNIRLSTMRGAQEKKKQQAGE
jgi:hypothetical protein